MQLSRLEIDEFLDQEDFSKLCELAKKIDTTSTTSCLKNNWYYTTDGKYGNIIRFCAPKPNKTMPISTSEQEFNPDFEESFQNKIYSILENFLEKYRDKIDQVGKSMVSSDFKLGHVKMELQYTDALRTHHPHQHHEDLNGTVYIFPKVAKGTIFLENEEDVVSWKPNKCCLHTKNILHVFENDIDTHKRFTLNFFATREAV